MKNLTMFVIAVLFSISAFGCGTALPHKVPNNAHEVSIKKTPAEKNVKVVMIRAKRSFTGNSEMRWLLKAKTLLDTSGYFNIVTTDPSVVYDTVEDLPIPQHGEYLLAMTIEEKDYFGTRWEGAKRFLSFLTAGISSFPLKHRDYHSSRITLSLVDNDGPIRKYEAESTMKVVATFWSLDYNGDLREAKQTALNQSMTSAVNNMVEANPFGYVGI